LSWILAGICRVERLRETLVFKGGTALKKCFFGRYRFSEDLDFSTLKGAPAGKALAEAVEESCEAAAMLLDEYAPVEIVCEPYTEKAPHPGGQEAFAIRCQFPWQRQLHTRVMLEISFDEPVLKPVQERQVIHEYGEPLHVTMQVYALEEIIAEKLRAILQHVEALEQRGWARSRARDYYDLWRVLRAYREQLDLFEFPSFLERKCAVRGVSFSGPKDFFQEPMLSHVERSWEQWLGPLVPTLPPFDTVIGELHSQIADLISTGGP
ncbi:MAG: nucleotidyl transferase AbiEii/AbiGii toxin family protein, partial [Gemmatimonadales bacterium]